MDPKKEEAFISGANNVTSGSAKPSGKSKPQEPTPPRALTPAAAVQPEPQLEPSVGRSPLTTRLRADIGAALKRASLERQLAGQLPNTVQDILEEALEPWLQSHGYLK